MTAAVILGLTVIPATAFGAPQTTGESENGQETSAGVLTSASPSAASETAASEKASSSEKPSSDGSSADKSPETEKSSEKPPASAATDVPRDREAGEGDPTGILNTDGVHTVVEEEPATKAARKAEVKLLSTLPEEYDSRTESWFKGISPADQDDTGLCWAIAVSSAARISYAKEKNKSFALSPVHLGYFTYHRGNDPLGNTGKDRNVILSGDGYDEIGGDLRYTLQALANQTGLARESLVPFSRTGEDLSSALEYNTAVTLRNGEVLETEAEIKQAVQEHGSAVTAVETVYQEEKVSTYKGKQVHAVYSSPDGANSKRKAAPDHSIVIVGWDDHFSKELFKKGIQPSRDGAWIIQDSQGPNYRDKGYYYLSYEEPLFDTISIDAQDAQSYDSVYEFDGNAYDSSRSIVAEGKMANIFPVSKEATGMILKAAGFTTWNSPSRPNQYDGLPYTVQVYTDISGIEDLEKKSPAASVHVTADKPGFHTVDLPKPVKLKAGSKFAVVVTLDKMTGLFGVEKSRKFENVLDFQSGTAKGQSYAYDPGEKKWTDLGTLSEPACARIKAFAEDEDHDLSKSKITLEYEETEWTGEEKRPKVTVRFNSRVLVPARDYDVTYMDNTDPGTATVLVEGKGGFTGGNAASFRIIEEEEEPETTKKKAEETTEAAALSTEPTTTVRRTAAEGMKSSGADTGERHSIAPAAGLLLGSSAILTLLVSRRRA